MTGLKSAGLAAIATAMAMSGALAADVTTIPTSGSIEMPIYDETLIDWSGFYAGVFTGVRTSDDDGTRFGLGVNAGVNASFEFYLLGAEVAVQGLTADEGSETAYGQILGRAGLIVTDNVAVYAAGGYGIELGGDDSDYLLGAGVELAVTDDVSVRAQYLREFPTQDDSDVGNQFTVGAQLQF